jgi:hypothetical protein
MDESCKKTGESLPNAKKNPPGEQRVVGGLLEPASPSGLLAAGLLQAHHGQAIT